MGSEHFGQKSALEHVIEKKTAGYLSLSESHGTEIPGHLSSAADAARESALLFVFFFFVTSAVMSSISIGLLAAFSLGLTFWKTGRSAWLGWVRLERLHRIIEQERYEIEHHRDQEKEELEALYSSKGFEGELLSSVVDVLMADNDRLLKVMLEEEMGLTLGAHEHPIKQALGAFIGSALTLVLLLIASFYLPSVGVVVVACALIGLFAALSAGCEKNAILPAIVWNLALASLAWGSSFFIFRMF
jgi:VIT1/CCC1 family predicted Fe2+/Mn2+ transporter